jgi:membrane protease YdiL (CAAX protease family)
LANPTSSSRQPAPERPLASQRTRPIVEVPPNSTFVRLSLLFYGVLWAVAYAWSYWSGEKLQYARWKMGGLGDAGAVATDVGIGVFAGLAVIGISHVLTERTQWGSALADALAGVIGRPSVSACIVLALASGVGEEALFRGALQPQVGLFAASLIFGFAHFAPRRELLPWSAFAVVMGLLMGWLFEYTGNLTAPTVAHVVINAVNLRLLAIRPRTLTPPRIDDA